MGPPTTPVIPHYPIPTVSTILSTPTKEEDPNTSPLPIVRPYSTPALSEVYGDDNEDEYLETLDRELLIQEVKRLKGQVANLMTLLNEQEEVKEENDVLKKSIIKFRKEVHRNISSIDPPRQNSTIWSQKEKDDVVSLTESLLSAPKPRGRPSVSPPVGRRSGLGGGRGGGERGGGGGGGGDVEKLEKENEELRAKLKEAQFKMAIQKRESDKKKDGRRSRP